MWDVATGKCVMRNKESLSYDCYARRAASAFYTFVI